MVLLPARFAVRRRPTVPPRGSAMPLLPRKLRHLCCGLLTDLAISCGRFATTQRWLPTSVLRAGRCRRTFVLPWFAAALTGYFRVRQEASSSASLRAARVPGGRPGPPFTDRMHLWERVFDGTATSGRSSGRQPRASQRSSHEQSQCGRTPSVECPRGFSGAQERAACRLVSRHGDRGVQPSPSPSARPR
jgi:hypothetical protein